MALRERVRRLDSLLLFASSSISIVFAVVQTVIGGVIAFVYFSPLVVIAWLMPIYVGYWRGAILLDSMVERIRGWEYLILGTAFYAAVVFIGSLRELARPLGPIPLALSMPSAAILSFLVGFGLFRIQKRLARTIARISDMDMSRELDLASSNTAEAGLFLGFAGFVPGATLADLERFGLDAVILSIGFAAVCVFMFIRNERTAREYSLKAEMSISTPPEPPSRSVQLSIVGWLLILVPIPIVTMLQDLGVLLRPPTILVITVVTAVIVIGFLVHLFGRLPRRA